MMSSRLHYQLTQTEGSRIKTIHKFNRQMSLSPFPTGYTPFQPDSQRSPLQPVPRINQEEDIQVQVIKVPEQNYELTQKSSRNDEARNDYHPSEKKRTKCKNCGSFEETVKVQPTSAAVMMAVCFFPLGLICCCLCKEKIVRCKNCVQIKSVY